MARCDQCGNDYDKAFNVTMADETYTFDSFECAVQKLAPAGSSDMASNRMTSSTAAHIAPRRKVRTR